MHETDNVNVVAHEILCCVRVCVRAQLKELEEEWGKLSGTPSVPTRFLRSQQQQQAAAVPVAASSSGGVAAEGAGGGVAAAVVPEVVDPYDLADPEDFLGKMPKDFFEKIVSLVLWVGVVW